MTSCWLSPRCSAPTVTAYRSASCAEPIRRLPLGAPTRTRVAYGLRTRRHADHDLLPATSSIRW
jgi:hypothetical protein